IRIVREGFSSDDAFSVNIQALSRTSEASPGPLPRPAGRNLKAPSSELFQGLYMKISAPRSSAALDAPRSILGSTNKNADPRVGVLSIKRAITSSVRLRS
ncbi:hypothetical protein, partial [Pseudomonas syringae]|uniref:hypothetical protein n=1 Tax=Pseudomonas syringae TaxID=317 RepID=UPI001C11597D